MPQRSQPSAMGHRCTLRLAFVRTGFGLIRQGGRQPVVSRPLKGMVMVRAAASRLQELAFRVWIGALGSCSIPLDWIGWFQRNCQQRTSNRSVLPFLSGQLDIAKLRCILFGRAGLWMLGISEPLAMDSATRMAFGN